MQLAYFAAKIAKQNSRLKMPKHLQNTSVEKLHSGGRYQSITLRGSIKLFVCLSVRL